MSDAPDDCCRGIDVPALRNSLPAFADPDRGFDAVVVGECDRAFSGTQLMQMAQTFLGLDVQI